MHSEKILAIVPAYNEVNNIAKTVEELRASPRALTVLVVDDGSGDGTALQAGQAGAQVISLPFNLGIGGAVQTGYLYACENDFDIAIQVDADGQHDPVYLGALLEPLSQGAADIVIGSRFIGDEAGYRSSFIRRIGIHFFAGLISFLSGSSVTDPTSGFRAVNAKAFRVFAEQYPTDFPEPEAIMIARRRGLRVLEVPVRMRSRHSGHSSIRYLKTLYYMVKVTFAILMDMIKKKKGERP